MIGLVGRTQSNFLRYKNCMTFLYRTENPITATWMHACVRFVCYGSMTQFSGHAGTSLPLFPLQRIYSLIPKGFILFLQERPLCWTWYVLFQEMAPNTKPFFEVYHVIYDSTFPSNAIRWSSSDWEGKIKRAIWPDAKYLVFFVSILWTCR